MVVYVEDADPVDVELLSVEEARAVLTRLKGELVAAYNAAHAEYVRRVIAEVEGQIAWLETEAAEITGGLGGGLSTGGLVGSGASQKTCRPSPTTP